jgi:hypothetical protein
MQMRWSILFPLLGLVLFGVVSYRSKRVNDELQRSPNRYFWWSSLRLDSDPLNQHPKPPELCEYDAIHCANWDVNTRKVSPGWLERALVISSFPAFLAGFALVLGLARQGINEVLTFMVVMPTLLFGWYFFAGRMLERWLSRRKKANRAPLKLT